MGKEWVLNGFFLSWLDLGIEIKKTAKRPYERLLGVARYSFATAAFLIGFILSPLTWWNDMVVNVPIAWVLASVLPSSWFKPAFIVSYWFTNILGLMMMHISGSVVIRKKVDAFSRGAFWKLAGFSTLYSLLFWLLMALGMIRPIDFSAITGIVHS
ncbi:MAG: hypothetical protein HQM16_12015 [Deltaproteobacteria bacterium]|nr:hypothetical protein [Deltaproteobacteria bacterium]